MEINVGDYVRTKDGIIDKVIIEYNGKCASPTCNCKHVSCVHNYYDEDTIIKSSPNIIDLIEVGDYVNGREVLEIKNFGSFNGIRVFGEIYYNEGIKTIVTKEQIEQMKYKIN